jgi:ribosomal protein S27E
MAIEAQVECPNCRRSIVPQLWIDDTDGFTQPRVFHLCPFCGVVVHETGGRTRWDMVIMLIVFGGLPLLFMLLWAALGGR